MNAKKKIASLGPPDLDCTTGNALYKIGLNGLLLLLMDGKC